MPVVEDLGLVVGEGAIVGHGILGLQTRLSEPPRAVLARKNVVRRALAIDVALSGDVKYIPCSGSWYG